MLPLSVVQQCASPDSMLDVPPKRSKRLRRARRRFFFYLAYVLLFHPPLYPFAALAQLPASEFFPANCRNQVTSE